MWQYWCIFTGRAPYYDEVDKEALKNMTKQRVTWTPQEDSLVMHFRCFSYCVAFLSSASDGDKCAYVSHKGAITSERKRKRRRLECIATGLCCLFTLERILSESESESDVASLPSCIGLQPIFGVIRSMLYRVSAACLPCCAIFK